MAERDKTITITSHLHFASAVNILGSCCYAAASALNDLQTLAYKKEKGNERREVSMYL